VYHAAVSLRQRVVLAAGSPRHRVSFAFGLQGCARRYNGCTAARIADMPQTTNMADQPRTPSPSLEGKYANYFEVGANPNELVIDFGQFYGRSDSPTLHTRIIIVPPYAREFAGLLNRWLIESSGEPPSPDPAPGAEPSVPPDRKVSLT
jgi:hypothetical protein